MFRQLLALTGIVQLVAGRRLIQWGHRIALANPDECRQKSWVVPLGRLEGLAFLLLAREGDGAYEAFKKVLFMVGMTALLSPRALINGGTALAFEEPTACEWKPWVYPLARLFGIGYVIVGVSSMRRGRPEES